MSRATPAARRTAPWRLLAALASVVGALATVLVVGGVAQSSSTELRSVVPARLAETRIGPDFDTIDGVGEGTGRVPAGGVLQITVLGRGGVPSNATAVLLNVTAVAPSSAGFLTVFPCGADVPNASSVNYAAGDVVPNAVLAGVGASGRVCVFTLAATDLVVDVTGYVPSGGSPVAVVPSRLFESRPGNTTVDGQQSGAGRRPAGSVTQVLVAGRGGVPETAAAVLLNVTAVAPSAAGFLTVFPCGADVPNASSVNYAAGDVVPNAVLAAVGGGAVCVYTLAETDLLVDVTGYVPAGGSPGGLVPARLLDSRPGQATVDGQQSGIGRRGAFSVTEVVVANRGGVPSDASAVLLNVTAVAPSAAGFLTVLPCGAYVPNASSVNYGAGDVVPNAVLAQIGAGGRVCVFTLAETDLLVDVTGFVPSIGGVTDTSVAPVTTAPPGVAPSSGPWTPIALVGGQPVRWDPCRPISFQIDPEGASPSAIEALFAAMASVEQATGFDFVYAGTYTATYTSFQPNVDRPSVPSAADVGFTFRELVDGLLGYAIPAWSTSTGEILFGTVTLDAPLSAGVDAKLVLQHELAHLVGLGHQDSMTPTPRQLMWPEYDPTITDYRAGDLQGLWTVGAKNPCFAATLQTGRVATRVIEIAGPAAG